MTESLESTDAGQQRPSRRRIALRWWLGGVVAAPVAVLSHALGHFLTYWALGLPGATLHYSSASWSDSSTFHRFVLNGDIAAAAELVPLWKGAAGLGMGLAATYVVVIAACLLCAKWRAHPAIVAIGYLSNVRIVAPVSVILLAAFGASVSSGCDECLLSLLTGIPLSVLTSLGIIIPCRFVDVARPLSSARSAVDRRNVHVRWHGDGTGGLPEPPRAPAAPVTGSLRAPSHDHRPSDPRCHAPGGRRGRQRMATQGSNSRCG